MSNRANAARRYYDESEILAEIDKRQAQSKALLEKAEREASVAKDFLANGNAGEVEHGAYLLKYAKQHAKRATSMVDSDTMKQLGHKLSLLRTPMLFSDAPSDLPRKCSK